MKSPFDLIAIIGAGPSLDYCLADIDRLIARGAKIMLSDSIAAGVLQQFPNMSAIVFTVEIRRHLYFTRLRSVDKFSVMAYHRANARNFRFASAPNVEKFKLLHEAGELPELYSPGTVLGVMLSYATQQAGVSEIHLFGADFSYIDNQVYSRFIDPHASPVNRTNTRELWQLEMAFKKTSSAILKSGFAIRTSFELMQARENMREYLGNLDSRVMVYEYSPIGFELERVQKCQPLSR